MDHDRQRELLHILARHGFIANPVTDTQGKIITPPNLVGLNAALETFFEHGE